MKFRLPFVIVTRKRLDVLESRIRDIERHFVTKRDDKGVITQTLADIPIEDRKSNPNRPNVAGKSWHQLKTFLELTDGGRKPV